ncbi:MAG: family 78 glycoside hydrolase catalytic domain [Bacteroidota bacterium]
MTQSRSLGCAALVGLAFALGCQPGGATSGTGGRPGTDGGSGSGGSMSGPPNGGSDAAAGSGAGGGITGAGGAGQSGGTGSTTGGAGGGGAGGAASSGGRGGAGNNGGTAGGQAGRGGQAGDSAGASVLVPTRLRAELRENPVGIAVATPRLGWEIEASDGQTRGAVQTTYEVLVASTPEKLAANDGDLLSTGVINSAESNLVYGGQPLAAFARAHWKVRIRDGAGRESPWSAAAEWTVGPLTTADWGAQWITGAAAGALPIFRREFAIAKPVQRALVAVCGLGQFELRVNGANATDAVMEPSWTHFGKTCHASTYDVTKALLQGANVLAVLLGNGMYNVPANSRYTKFTGSFGAPKLIARLQVEHTDGTKTSVVTDTAWKTTAGPITFTNIFGGEDFDARLEPTGWDKPGFSDTAWPAATVASGTAPALVGRSAPPIKVMQEFSTPKITQPAAGVFVYDLGQNFAGWPEITVQGVAGATVRLTPGEVLTAQGLVSQTGSGGPAWYAFTPRGTAAETWHPRFTYTGFRYVQVDGAVPAAMAASFPARPQVTALTGKFLHAAAESVGTFTSSDADLNKIHALILAALRSNLQSVLTDCPHREKLGWLETSHLLAHSIAFNYDVGAFYEKILRDMRDAQTADGLIPDIAPETTVFAGAFRDSPEWGSAFVINPWFVYQMYGNRRPLDEHYANMKRYVAYLGGKASQNIVAYGLGDWYDIGPAAPGASQLTTAGVTGTAIWLQDLAVLRQAATLLGKPDEATQFQATETTVTNAFNARFLTAAGAYDRNSQTANAMPLALGLVPAAQRAAVLASLVGSVTSAQNRVTAGDVGFLYLIRALSEAGRSDVVYGLVKQATGPGYLYQINHGATALTESWDARPASSQNHAMLGHAEEWLYRGLGGLNPDPAGPGWKKSIIKPQPQTGLASVEASYHSVRGVVASSWQRTATGLTLTVSVPVNTTATVYVPTANPAAVTEGGGPAMTAPGVTSSSQTAGALVLQLGSGRYTFVAP